MPKKTKPKTPKTPNPLPYDGYLTDPANPEQLAEAYWGAAMDPAPMTGSTNPPDTAKWGPLGAEVAAARELAEPFWATAQHYATRNYTIDSLSTVLDAATQAILTQRADVMPQAVKVAQAALARLLEALQVDPKAKEGAK